MVNNLYQEAGKRIYELRKIKGYTRDQLATKAELSAKFLYEKMYTENPDDEGFLKTTPLEFGVKKKSPITPAQLRYLKSLIQIHGIVPEVMIESLTKSEASRMIDNILSSYGRI